ncbi:hypothetical protein ACJ6WF_00135 [Streptomyces sp. MMS24-I2-30]|uniref:hypothetical protein n=1 Tax=Streptomyces sp. MMS24-I2-30 TaxID=3351564 RepID=UPI003896CCDA
MPNSSGTTGGNASGSPAANGAGDQLPPAAAPGPQGASGGPTPAPQSPANPPTTPPPGAAPTPAGSSTTSSASAAAPAEPSTTGTPSAPDSDLESRWRHKPNLIGLLTLVATVVGIVLAIYYGNDSSESGQSQAKSGDVQASTGVSEAARQPNLKVARIAAYIKEGIDGKEQPDAGQEALTDLRGPHLDITFENRAPGPSLITKATLRVREAGVLPGCHQIGGELAISVNYDFPLPDKLPKTPYEQSKDISFTVEDNKLDRLTLTMGPENHGWENPWYGVVDIVFEHDGTKTTVSPVAVVDTGGDAEFYPDGDTWVIKNISIPTCLDENAALVDRLMSIPDVTVSKELKTLRDKLTSMGH